MTAQKPRLDRERSRRRKSAGNQPDLEMDTTGKDVPVLMSFILLTPFWFCFSKVKAKLAGNSGLYRGRS